MSNDDSYNPDYEELASQLDALARQEGFVVDETLKAGTAETTQRGHYESEPSRALLRKTFDGALGLGGAYERIRAAQLSSKLTHVPYVYSCENIGDKTVVVTDFARGETLSEVVGRCGASVRLAADVFGLLCDAVSELHERFDPPIIHRDLKPENVILSATELFIIDFGIARSYNGEGECDTVRFGTRAWAPPEQYGYAQTSVRSDVYALGLLLYYCLVGAAPGAAERELGFVHDCIPEQLTHVVAKAAAFDPAQRYASARELKTAFECAVASLPVTLFSPKAARVHAGVWNAMGLADIAAPLEAEEVQDEDSLDAQFADEAAPSGAQTGNEQRKSSAALALRLALPLSYVRDVDGFTEWAHNIPHGVGRAWNVIVLLVYAFWEVIAIAGPFTIDPSRTNNAPMGVVLMMFWFMFTVWFTSVAWLVLDKRRLKRRFPGLARVKWWQTLASCALAIVISLGLTCVVYALWMPSS